MKSEVSPARSFDPRRVGELELATWVSYYRREWWAFLRSALLLTRHAFGVGWGSTTYGAWLVLRANQAWAPYPDNRPDAARRYMRRFYALLRRRHGEPRDVDLAASLEVEWWRVHRERQHSSTAEPDTDEDPLVDAIARLYAHVYGVEASAVRLAAAERTAAMDLSDAWVEQGCDPQSRLLSEERACLVRSYAALLARVHRPPPSPR